MSKIVEEKLTRNDGSYALDMANKKRQKPPFLIKYY